MHCFGLGRDSCPSIRGRICSEKYVFYFSGDELLSDSFPYVEVHNGVLWEVEGKVGVYFVRLLLII